MIAIKDMEISTGCCEFHKDTNLVIHCPLYNSCDKRTTVKVNFKPIDCPLVEIVTCKDCVYCRFEVVEGIPYYLCDKDSCATSEDYYCGGGERRK